MGRRERQRALQLFIPDRSHSPPTSKDSNRQGGTQKGGVLPQPVPHDASAVVDIRPGPGEQGGVQEIITHVCGNPPTRPPETSRPLTN